MASLAAKYAATLNRRFSHWRISANNATRTDILKMHQYARNADGAPFGHTHYGLTDGSVLTIQVDYKQVRQRLLPPERPPYIMERARAHTRQC